MSGPTRLLAGALVRQARRGEAARGVPHLLVPGPDGADRAVALPPELTLGRGPAVGLALADPGASRRHARVRLDGDGAAAVEDLGSKNGLRLNGRRLRPGPAALRDGDVLTVGATALRYVDPLASAPAGEPGEVAAAGAAPAPVGAPPTRGRVDRRRLEPAGRLALAAGLLALAALLLARS